MILRIFANEDIDYDNGILVGSVVLGGHGGSQSQELRVGGNGSLFFCHLGTL